MCAGFRGVKGVCRVLRFGFDASESERSLVGMYFGMLESRLGPYLWASPCWI